MVSCLKYLLQEEPPLERYHAVLVRPFRHATNAIGMIVIREYEDALLE